MQYPVLTINHIGSSFFDKLGTSKTILFPIVSALGAVLYKYTNTTGLVGFSEVDLKFYNSANTTPKNISTGEDTLNLDADGYVPFELQKSSAGSYNLRFFDSSANADVLPPYPIVGQTNILESYPSALGSQFTETSQTPYPDMQGTNYYGSMPFIIGRKRRVRDIDNSNETLVFEEVDRSFSGTIRKLLNFYDSEIFPHGMIRLENPYLSRAFSAVTASFSTQALLKASNVSSYVKGDIIRCTNALDSDEVVTHWYCLGVMDSQFENALTIRTKSGFGFRLITSDYISPEHFGCKIDATEDASKAFQKAIEACSLDNSIKKIVLNGNYLLNSSIFYEGLGNLVFEGGCIYAYNNFTIKDSNSCLFNKVRFRGKSLSSGGGAVTLTFYNLNYVTFDECAFEDYKGLVDIKANIYIGFKNNFFLNGNAEMLKLKRGSKDLVVTITNNFFSNCLGGGSSLVSISGVPKYHDLSGNIFKSCTGYSLFNCKEFTNLFIENNALVNSSAPLCNPDPLVSSRDTNINYLGIVHLKKCISSSSVDTQGLVNLFKNDYSKHDIILNMCAVTGRSTFLKLNQTIPIKHVALLNSRAWNNSAGVAPIQGFNTSAKVENLHIANVTIDGSNNAKIFSDCQNVNSIKETKNLYVDTKGRMSYYRNLKSGAFYEDNYFLRPENSFSGGVSEFTHAVYLDTANPIKIVLIKNTLDTDGTTTYDNEGNLIPDTNGSSSPLLYAFRVGNGMNHVYLTDNRISNSSQSIISAGGSILEDIEDLRLFKTELIRSSLTLSTDAFVEFLEIYTAKSEKPKYKYCNEGTFYFQNSNYVRTPFSSPMRVSSISQELNRPEIKFEIPSKAVRMDLVNGTLKGGVVCIKQTTISSIAKGCNLSLDRFWYIVKIDVAENVCSLQLSNMKDGLKGVFPPRAYTRDIVPSVGSNVG